MANITRVVRQAGKEVSMSTITSAGHVNGRNLDLPFLDRMSEFKSLEFDLMHLKTRSIKAFILHVESLCRTRNCDSEDSFLAVFNGFVYFSPSTSSFS
jgi:hypothetical protein